jgi:hypothetical protein
MGWVKVDDDGGIEGTDSGIVVLFFLPRFPPRLFL